MEQKPSGEGAGLGFELFRRGGDRGDGGQGGQGGTGSGQQAGAFLQRQTRVGYGKDLVFAGGQAGESREAAHARQFRGKGGEQFRFEADGEGGPEAGSGHGNEKKRARQGAEESHGAGQETGDWTWKLA